MKIIRSGEHYRQRAEECRAIAEMLIEEEPRRRMLTVAADYDKMAVVADKLEEQTK